MSLALVTMKRLRIDCSKPFVSDLLKHQHYQQLSTEKVNNSCQRFGDRIRCKSQAIVKDVFAYSSKVGLAPRDGFEPPAKRLTVACSTAELPGNKP